MKVHIGTSGFQYPAWKGSFYPSDLPVSKMLPFYAERFSATEINYTFRHIPSEKTINGWLKATPTDFEFALKAPQKITHFAKLKNCAESVNLFCDAVSGLGEKCGPILFQLPPTFKQDLPVLGDFLQALPEGMLAAFEFRHASWFADATFDLLGQFKAALCVAESDELATPLIQTADFGYLRLRKTHYSSSELRKWAEDVNAQPWGHAFLFFKHEDTGTGPAFGIEMTEFFANK